MEVVRKKVGKPTFLCFPYELFFAAGAGNRDLSFVPGYPHRLVTAGAVEMPMLPILQPFQKTQIFSIFLVAFVDIPGQKPQGCQDYQHIGQADQGQLDQSKGENVVEEIQTKGYPQQRHIQFVTAVAALHKPSKAGAQFFSKPTQPVADPVH